LIGLSINFAHAETINLDGKLVEPYWQNATVYRDFYKVQPATLAIDSNKTEARVFTNEQGIYLGIINKQSVTQRKKQYNLQDAFIQADANTVVIDFAGDGSGAYLFSLGLGGGIKDAVLTPQLTTDFDWDGAWQYGIHEEDSFWSSEIFIPWHTVSFRASFDEEGYSKIGVSIQLLELAKNHTHSSQPQTISHSDFFINMPKIKAKTPAEQQFVFVPYLTQQQDFIQNKPNTDLGFDFAYKPNHHQKISLAVNPDFGQVDSDELVMNYSSVETLRTDKRPFFTQDISVFNVQSEQDTRLIHTRRIGAGSDDGSETITPIDAALRFVHQGENIQLGAFAVHENSLDTGAGKDFAAGRIKYRSDNWQSGLLATHVERPWLNRQGQTMAWDSQYQSETWSFQSALLLSHVTTSTVKASTVIKSNIANPILKNSTYKSQGYGFSGNSKYQINPNIDISASYLRLDDQFDNSDLGYLKRNNWRYSDLNYNHAVNLTNSYVERIKHSVKASYESNDAGLKLRAQQQYHAALLLTNGSQFEATLSYFTSGWEDNLRNDIEPFYYPSGLSKRIMYLSPYTGWLSWAASYQRDEEGLDGMADQYALDMTIMPHPNWNIKFNNFFRTGDGWLIGTGKNQISQFDRDLFVNTIKLSGLVMENLELSINFQLAILEAQAKDIYQVGNHELERLEAIDTSLEDKRFSFQFKLRYKLGAYSDIYLVYSRGGVEADPQENNIGNKAWLRSLDDMWQQPTNSLLTAKIRYLF
jgi:hypothetical protein